MEINSFAGMRNTYIARPADAAVTSGSSNVPMPEDGFKGSVPDSAGLPDPKSIANLAAAASALFTDNPGFTEKWRVDLVPPATLKELPDENVQMHVQEDGIFLNAFGYTKKYDFNGKECWKMKTNADKHFPVNIGADGSLYQVGTKDLQKITPGGRLEWTRHGGSRNLNPNLTVKGNNIYTVNWDGTLTCFDQAGRVGWSAHPQNAVQDKPAVDDFGRVYMLGEQDSEGKFPVLMMDPATRKEDGEVEAKSLGNFQNFVNIGSDGTLYTMVGNSYCALGSDGKPVWSLPLPIDNVEDGGMSVNAVSGPDGNMYIRSAGPTRNDSVLICVKPDGSKAWELERKNDFFLDNYLWDSEGTVYFTTYAPIKKPDGTEEIENALLAIDSKGNQKWRTGFSNQMFTSSLSLGSDGAIFMGASGEHFRAFDPKNGKVIAESKNSGTLEGYGVDKESNIFAVMKDNDGKESLVRIDFTSPREVAEKLAAKAEEDASPSPSISKEGENVDIGGAVLKKRKRKI